MNEVVVKEDQHVMGASVITPMQMLQIAVEKGADLDQLQKLMDLQERWEAAQAKKAYTRAMTAFKADPPKVSKNKHVSFGSTEYDHATLDEIVSVVAPALSAHGLSHSWGTSQPEPGAIAVTCELTHVDGYSESITLSAAPDNSGGKNSIQAVGSTVTYLQRYTLLSKLGLAPGDDNDGARDVDFITAEQKDELIALQKDVSADTAAFLKYLGVDSLDHLPAARFKDAKAALEKKRQAADKANETEG